MLETDPDLVHEAQAIKDKINKNQKLIEEFAQSPSVAILAGKTPPIPLKDTKLSIPPIPESPAGNTRSKLATIMNTPKQKSKSSVNIPASESAPNIIERTQSSSSLGTASTSENIQISEVVIPKGPEIIECTKQNEHQDNVFKHNNRYMTAPHLQRVANMNDNEICICLKEAYPELSEELEFLMQCPEKIGMLPMRDLLMYRVRSTKNVVLTVQAMVAGLKAGLSYTLREQHSTYTEMFKEMKNIMTESAKVIRETSDSLEQTLRVENVESGKTVSSLKETLGMAQELAKTLSEGRTHQHTQVPSRPPSKTSIPISSQPEPTPGCSRDDPEPATIEQKIITMIQNMKKDEYQGIVDLSKGFMQIKTEINQHKLTLTYDECKGYWSIRKNHFNLTSRISD